tara:strand:+ start:1679 stop:2374 length:696 start_codon:yes stop_codon:yes gene_type:complete
MTTICDYDVSIYDFCGEVEKIFKVSRGGLDNLHEFRNELMPIDKLNFGNETRTNFHSTFYDALNSSSGDDIRDVYERFIKDVVSPMFEGSFVYQTFPSFRVHIPNDQAIHKWHYDSDEDHNHPDWEINFQIALTKIWDSNAMWVESIPGLGDFQPVEMSAGDCTIFYGNKCVHGNKENKTGKTRVSMDFRVMPYDKYDESAAKSSATASRKFVIGDYYRLCEDKGDTDGLA